MSRDGSGEATRHGLRREKACQFVQAVVDGQQPPRETLGGVDRIERVDDEPVRPGEAFGRFGGSEKEELAKSKSAVNILKLKGRRVFCTQLKRSERGIAAKLNRTQIKLSTNMM